MTVKVIPLATPLLIQASVGRLRKKATVDCRVPRNSSTWLAHENSSARAAAARADEFPWANHVEEFRGTRQSTVAFFRNLPAEAWTRSGVASGMTFTVNALAYLAAGHLAHHLAILRERYL